MFLFKESLSILPNTCINSPVMDTQNQPILLNTSINDDHDDNGDDEEEKENNVDSCVPLSRPLSQLCFFLSPHS